MGLESFYFGVKTAIFSSRGSAPHPAAGAGPWADPRVRPQRPQNLELGYRQKSPLPVRPRKKGRFIHPVISTCTTTHPRAHHAYTALGLAPHPHMCAKQKRLLFTTSIASHVRA